MFKANYKIFTKLFKTEIDLYNATSGMSVKSVALSTVSRGISAFICNPFFIHV